MADVSPQLERAVRMARDAKTRAYAPYSRFHVGAVLECADGTLVPGCNVENASYPAGLCAERGALAAAVSAGHRQFVRVVIVTDAETATPPCGMCRQALVEFNPALEVVSIAADEHLAIWSLRDLLPLPFTPASLTND